MNIGSTEEVMMEELAALVREIAGSGSLIEKIPYDVAYAEGFEDMPRRVPDVSKLRRLTGEVPDTPLQRIVEDVLEDQRARLG